MKEYDYKKDPFLEKMERDALFWGIIRIATAGLLFVLIILILVDSA